MIKNEKNGVIHLVIESDTLITSWANWGETLACINIGTTIGEKICHFVEMLVQKILAKAIIIKVMITKGIPERSRWESKVANHDVIIIPILLFFQIAKNCEVTNIKIKSIPISLNFDAVLSIKSLSL